MKKLQNVMMIISLSYNIGGSLKVAVCNDHHEVITKEEVKKLRHVIMIISWSYNIGGKGKFAVCNDYHQVITKEETEKLRYVMSIIKLKQQTKWKSCGM